MIGELLPDRVVAVEAHGEDDAGCAPLYPEEEAVVAEAIVRRRREFAVVRACARRALGRLGVPPGPILPGERGAPRWPDGVVGSMTHCDGYRAAAVARATDLLSLGIDAEPHVPLPDGVLRPVALPSERDRIDGLALRRPSVHWDRLLFSAKESVYKAWFPMTGEWLGFDDADIEIRAAAGGPRRGGFRATLLVPGPPLRGGRLVHVEGKWMIRRDLIVTAAVVPR
ncbi:4'-phosphopantetheinyl transferase [Streptomyces anulatus]|uniref:4'-phosphopantetheinyl transferase family protein n=1 Tax=Streptomyces anulatus TaxID=1892 RepID=UPI001C2621CF|nr:4'-phosphopantetheinyl transferase superfamily protein [Streptomyces anulatus]